MLPEGIDGHVDPAFRRVAEAFAESVAMGGERGGLALRLDGRAVLDIRGGMRDPESGLAWDKDTLACCFSVTKGVFVLLTQKLVDRGVLDPGTCVATLWPAFAAKGKDAITLHDVLTHRAGLPATETAVPNGLLYDQPAMAAALAASAPVTPLRAAPAYHNMTYGTLLTAILEAATREDIRTLIARVLTGPLGADFTIGLSPQDRARTAVLTQDDPGGLFRAMRDAPETLFARSMAFFDPEETFTSERWQSTVIGSGSGHATAAGIARLYEAFIAGDFLSPERRRAIGQEVARTDADAVLGLPLRLGEGMELSAPPLLDFGPNPRSMGYWGAGGAQGFADPDAGLAFGYVTGHMDATLGSSPRCRALIREVYACL